MAEPFAPDPERLRRVLQIEAVDRFVLDNGLTVLHLEDHSAELVSAQLWVKTGSIHEGDWMGAGLSHYLEHLLFKGTARRADGEIARQAQEHGANINAYTTYDRTVYYLDLPSEHLAFALDVLSDMAFHARLDEEDIRREREVILREISMGLDDPDRKVSRAAFRNAFKVHPYGHPVIGHRSLFSRVPPEAVRSYYAERYVPSNIVLVVVGAVDNMSLREAIESTFAPVEARPVRPVWVPSEPPQLAQRSERLAQEVEVCRGVLAFRVPHLAHPDAPGLDLLATILGRGQSSLLWQDLREQRELVHHISATCWNPGESGLLWISYTCDPAQRPMVEVAIQAHLADLASKGFTQAQVDKARRLAWVDEVNVRKTMSGQASRLGAAEVIIGDVGYAESYFRSLGAVTTEQLTRLIIRYLNPDRLTTVSLNTPLAEAFSSKSRKTDEPPGDFLSKTLPNGARLLWQRDARLPKVNIRLSGLGGGLFESPAKRGATALLTRLLARDSRWQSAAEVAESVESVGGVFHEYTGNNSFGLSLEVMTEDLPLARSLLEDAVLDPRWDPASFAREKAAQLADLREARDDIVDFARRSLRRHFFGDHPLAVDPVGEMETLEAITLEDLQSIYDRLFVASNLVLTIVGDIKPERDLPPLEAFLLDLPDWAFPLPKQPFSGPEQGDFFEAMDREQMVVMLAFPDVGVRSEEELTSQLLDAICSDMSSELFRQVREERGLAYYVSSLRTVGLESGQFAFYAGTRPDAADEVLEVLRAEARRLREQGPAEAEISRARTRLKARMRTSLQSPASRASHASLNALYGRPINDWQSFDARLDAIDVQALRSLAARFTEEQSVSLKVGPKPTVG